LPYSQQQANFSSLTHINPVDATLSHSVSGPISILSFHLHRGLPHVSPPKSYTQLSPPRTSHYPICLIPLDVVTRIISDEQHKSRSSSLCSCLQSPSYFLLLRPKYLSQHPILECHELRSFFP